jgi:hypothetical protein
MNESPGARWSRQFRDWIDSAGQKTEEIARVSKRQIEWMQLEWDLIRRRASLAERVMRLIDRGEFPGWSKDPHLVDLVEEVRALERMQREKKLEIDEIRRGGPADEDWP